MIKTSSLRKIAFWTFVYETRCFCSILNSRYEKNSLLFRKWIYKFWLKFQMCDINIFFWKIFSFFIRIEYIFLYFRFLIDEQREQTFINFFFQKEIEKFEFKNWDIEIHNLVNFETYNFVDYIAKNDIIIVVVKIVI